MASISHNNHPRQQAYATAALDAACAAIVAAPKGLQDKTRHRECYAIGGLVAAGVIPQYEALDRLRIAARSMPAFSDKWDRKKLDALVKASLERGMQAPRRLPDGDLRPQRQRRQAPPPPPPAASCEPPDAEKIKLALALWDQGLGPRNTPVELYLAIHRELTLPDDLVGEVIRWAPGRRHPNDPENAAGAMLALFRSILTGAPQAVSRIFLDHRFQKIERKFLGPTKGAAIMLDAFEEVTHGLHIGEGLETCMAGWQMGLRPTWAVGSADAIATFPVLGGVEALTLFTEIGCPANARALEACAARWHAAGREVWFADPTDGKDLNDALIEKAAHPPRKAANS
jgi:hypothetical protein